MFGQIKILKDQIEKIDQKLVSFIEEDNPENSEKIKILKVRINELIIKMRTFIDFISRQGQKAFSQVESYVNFVLQIEDKYNLLELRNEETEETEK